MIQSLKAVFARHGIADIAVSDNGPQYSSNEFCKSLAWEFKYVTTSPHYPRSHGKAESVMQDSFEEVTDFITVPAARACATSVSCVFSL